MDNNRYFCILNACIWHCQRFCKWHNTTTCISTDAAGSADSIYQDATTKAHCNSYTEPDANANAHNKSYSNSGASTTASTSTTTVRRYQEAGNQRHHHIPAQCLMEHLGTHGDTILNLEILFHLHHRHSAIISVASIISQMAKGMLRNVRTRRIPRAEGYREVAPSMEATGERCIRIESINEAQNSTESKI
jgi:hypothetical protein